jgi:hypothetical protein
LEEETLLIAPCGMNCGICRAYLRKEKKCPGCHGDSTSMMVSTFRCIIRNCETIKNNKSGFCFECEKYPCNRLKHLDKRYRTKYKMSMLENLENVKTIGVSAFYENERMRWRCAKCGGVICVHKGYCFSCGEKAN